MTLLRLISLDALHLLRERLAIGVLAIGFLCAALGAFSGYQWLRYLETERNAFVAEASAASQSYRDQLASGELSEDARALAPVRVTLPLAYTTPGLADFSVGRSNIEPSTATVRMRYRTDTLFRNYQFDNPEALARGRFDLSFVAIVIAPLLLIALSYGLFASDRDRGTATLVLAQAGSPLTLLSARAFNRLVLVAAPLVLCGLLLWAFGPNQGDRLPAVLLWLGAALLGLCFWQALILFINSLRIGAETAALSLVALWLLLVFAAPAAINASAQAVFPPPSRLAQIVEARAAEIEATGSYQNDHPELTADAALPLPEQYRRTVERNYRIGLAIEARIAPITQAFDSQLRGQMALAERWQWLSPPMTLSGQLAAIAGTDPLSYANRRSDAYANLADFKHALGRVIEERRSLNAQDFDMLPRFEERPPERAPLLPLGFVLIVTLGFLGLAAFRLR
jgi:ABC-2 type transport system permease protein